MSSPPYGDIRQDGGAADTPTPSYTGEPNNYWHTQRDQTNIGNLRGGDLPSIVEAVKSGTPLDGFPSSYWKSMAQVYEQCHAVLRPQGVMVLVLKGFTRAGKYIDLPEMTKVLVESLGFRLFDHWKRELWSLSFWRILQKRRDPAAFDDRLKFEEVLAFRRE